MGSHTFFRREGHDLLCSVPIKMTAAALGGSISIPFLDGKGIEVQVPAGIQSGNKIKIAGKGMPDLRSSRPGDLYIETVVETPVSLSEKQKKLLMELDSDLSLAKSSPKYDSFFKKIKNMFTDG